MQQSGEVQVVLNLYFVFYTSRSRI